MRNNTSIEELAEIRKLRKENKELKEKLNLAINGLIELKQDHEDLVETFFENKEDNATERGVVL